ncbi:MAG: hypothetical protein GX424_11265 [Clostridiales bacterium]|jgi:hypothetical protein|nr:hypothetical protein [Clostridiales bacterium]
MNRKEKFWIGAAMLFLGTFIGFALSPIKKGIYIGNHSGNTCLDHDFCDDDEFDDDEDLDDDSTGENDDLPF